jgi:hypothetical protein
MRHEVHLYTQKLNFELSNTYKDQSVKVAYKAIVRPVYVENMMQNINTLLGENVACATYSCSWCLHLLLRVKGLIVLVYMHWGRGYSSSVYALG